MRKKICEAVILFVGTLGWWGFVYPELCPDGVCQEEEYAEEDSREEPEAQKVRDAFSSGETSAGDEREGLAGEKKKAVSGSRTAFWESGWQLGEIRIKSRFMEYVCQIRENPAKEKRLEDEE